jgi:hypothetical protein
MIFGSFHNGIGFAGAATIAMAWLCWKVSFAKVAVIR